MRLLLDKLYLASGALAAFFILAIAALVMAQVTLNVVDRIAALTTGTAVGLTIPSYSDFTGFFLAAASFLALAHTLRSGEHIQVTLITSRLPRQARRVTTLGVVVVALAVTLYLAWYVGALVIESHQFGDLSSGMIAVPLWIPQMLMAIGIVVLAVALADELHGLLRGRDPSWETAKKSRQSSRVDVT